MASIRSLGVYCGSRHGDGPFEASAAQLGRLAAREGLTIVYGGGSVGLMGVLADAALQAGGRVVGVIPKTLFEREVGHRGLSETHIVDTMHERKAIMSDLSDAFIALPGAVGTLDELFETWTWAQLGVHEKPFGLLNVAGYYDALLEFLRGVVAHDFMKPIYLEMLQVDTDVSSLLGRIRAYRAPHVVKWISRETI